VVLAAAVAVVVLGATTLALALVALCVLGMTPAIAVAGRLERRGPSD
jgi:hypothetical protein